MSKSVCLWRNFDGSVNRGQGHVPSMKHTENGRILACIHCLQDLTVIAHSETDLTWVTKHVITEWP